MQENLRDTSEDEAAAGVSRSKAAVAAAVAAAILALLAVFLYGLGQFRSRAGEPICMVKEQPIPGEDANVGEGILDFLEDRGVEVVREGFEPSWGAEELRDGLWRVSYVYEVGREANWTSWEVDISSGEIVPLDDTARGLLEGDGAR